MLKLNNKGWGLSSMVFYTSIILVALLVATFYVIALYSDLDRNLYDSNNDSTFKTYEEDLKNNALNYIIARTFEDGNYTITYYVLKNNSYLEKITDSKTNNECDGYVKVNVKDSNYEAKSYLKCDSYVTEGY